MQISNEMVSNAHVRQLAVSLWADIDVMEAIGQKLDLYVAT